MDVEPAFADLLDPVALVIVLAGTLIATMARAGIRDLALALRLVMGLTRRGFDEHANRIALARWASAVRSRGLLSVNESFPPDADLAQALECLVRSGSTDAFKTTYERSRAARLARYDRAAQVFEHAGELAPVFGLVGTLFAMTQIAPVAGSEGEVATFEAIATAVLSSLYGVLTAHLLFLPMAEALARRVEREEDARARLAAWVCEEIEDALPKSSGRRNVTKLTPAA